MNGGRWRRSVLRLAVLLLMLMPTVAWAAEGGEGEAEPVSLFNPNVDLAIWTLLIFLILLFILWRYAWGPMLEGLHKREESIHGAISEAQKAREEAQRLQAKWQEQMNQAHETVRQIHEDARRKAEANANEIQARARSEIQAERERLRREIESARDQALQELWNQTAQLATQVSAKAIGRELTTDDHRRLVEEALAQLPQASQEHQQQVAGARV